MVQQQYIQQEIASIAGQHELGEIQQVYDNEQIGGKLTCLALVLLLPPAPFFIIFLVTSIKASGIFSPAFAILALVICLWIFTTFSRLRKLYHDRHSQRLLYTHGFMVMKCRDEQIIAVEAIHWREIAIIWREAQHSNTKRHRLDYTLQRANGEIFGKTVQENVGDLINTRRNYALGTHIEQMTLPYLWPGAISAYRQGRVIVFGPLTIHTDGIQYQDKTLPWHAFASLKEDRQEGQLLLMSKDGSLFPGTQAIWALVPSDKNPRLEYRRLLQPWAIIPCAQIPNLALFIQLVQSRRGNPPQWPDTYKRVEVDGER